MRKLLIGGAWLVEHAACINVSNRLRVLMVARSANFAITIHDQNRFYV